MSDDARVPWKTYRFFDVKQDAFESQKNGTLEYTCAGSGHGLLCFASDDPTEKQPVVKMYDSTSQETATSPMQIAEEYYSIKQIHVGQFQDVFLAVCEPFEPDEPEEDEDPKKKQEDRNHFRFYLYRTGCPADQAQKGYVTIPKTELPELRQVAVSPKIKRFGVVMDDTTINVYETPYDKKTKPFQIKVAEKITNVMMVSDFSLQRIIYITTEARCVAYFRLDRNKVGPEIVLDAKEGCESGFAATSGDGRLVCVRGANVSMYNKNGDKTSFVIEQVPRLIAWMKNAYLVACFNAPASSSSVRIYNYETHSTFGRCSDGDRVKLILTEWNSILLVLDDNTVTRLTETDMQEKIQQLVKNEQFEVALVIANSQQMSDKVIANIHRQRGDSYCEKTMFEKAIEEYILTIGHLEPSYVITRFIDPQHAEFLVRYLEALNEKHLETKQHTTLRFNCYTKLREQKKLKQECDACVEAGEKGLEPSFDLETAVSVLILAGYKEDALRIAKAHHMHEYYTRMLSETHDYLLILEYLRGVETKICKMILQRYGNDMMTDFDAQQKETFIEFMLYACEHGLKAKPDSDLLEQLNPDDIMRVFLNFPIEHYSFLTRYVEWHASEEQKSLDRVSKDVWNTIIELACTQDHEEDCKRYFEMANGNFDSEQLLLMFSAQDCHYGKLMIYEHLKYFQEILKISQGAEIPEVCLKYGKFDVDMWRQALVMLSQTKDEENLKTLIEYITQEDALPLLAVVQILRNQGFATMGMLKPLAQKTFRVRQAHIEKLQADYQALEDEVSRKEDEADDLVYKHFIAKSIRCAGCQEAIDLPAKHFLCGHSFHMACLGDDLTKCPVCKEKQEQIVRQKLQSYKQARYLLQQNLDPSEKYKYKLLEFMNTQEYGADPDTPLDTFAKLCECLQGDLLNPDEEKEKKHEAKKLLAEYTQH